MAILLNNHGHDATPWAEALRRFLPDIPIHCYPNIPNVDDIKYAVIWNHPHGDLLRYPNLEAILLLGAGTDLIDNDPALHALQPDVPLIRLLDPDVGNDMAQYVCYWAMHFHRRYEDYREQAGKKIWRRYELARSADTRVSVLGLGLIGAFIAERLALNGFQAQAWNRTEKQLDNVHCFSGNQGLIRMLAATDILVNCLPLNAQTTHFIDEAKLSLLPKGAFLINVSRGAVIDEDALLRLLNSEHLAGAALDTFNEEPLTVNANIWNQAPQVQRNLHITPHIAGATYAKSAAKVVADNIIKMEQGKPPFPIHKVNPITDSDGSLFND